MNIVWKEEFTMSGATRWVATVGIQYVGMAIDNTRTKRQWDAWSAVPHADDDTKQQAHFCCKSLAEAQECVEKNLRQWLELITAN